MTTRYYSTTKKRYQKDANRKEGEISLHKDLNWSFSDFANGNYSFSTILKPSVRLNEKIDSGQVFNAFIWKEVILSHWKRTHFIIGYAIVIVLRAFRINNSNWGNLIRPISQIFTKWARISCLICQLKPGRLKGIGWNVECHLIHPLTFQRGIPMFWCWSFSNEQSVSCLRRCGNTRVFCVSQLSLKMIAW